MAHISFKLDMVQTVALAALVLFMGYGVRRRAELLDKYNIPAPVIGGFLFAALALALRQAGWIAFEFDTVLQGPLMVAFFTTIGLGASLSLLRVGGPQVLLFWGLASILAVLQNGIGVLLARALGMNPLVGLIAGSITMTGGHGTGAAFGKLIEDQYLFPGGVTLAMAAATFGLVSGGLIGGPVGTRLIEKFELRLPGTPDPATAALPARKHDFICVDTDGEEEPPTSLLLLEVVTVVLAAMWGGSLLSRWLGQYVTLPAYIGAMLVAAAVRNLADITHLMRIRQDWVEVIGTIALSLFLSMALMTLRLWELLGLAIPLLVILAAQVTLMAAFGYAVTFRVMGRDYEAAVMAGGHCGFGLGATPSAVANMEAIVEHFGPAPRAYLVVPMVGAFFIDFTNALIIMAFINIIF